MIASDTSSLSALLKGETGADVDCLAAALSVGELCLPPVVLTELLSDPRAGETIAAPLLGIPLLPLPDGFWRRAADTRRTILKLGLKAKVADALVAQACIDNNVALVTRDSDFRHYVRYCGLMIA